jgi:SnoaL-like domain
MDLRLQEMLDHHEIRQVLATYCHACDRADEIVMTDCYSGDDSFDDHGLVRAAGPEYARQMTDLVRLRTDAVSHILGQSLIKVNGDKAVSETFFLGLMRLKPDEDGVSRLNQLAGRFVDELVRVDGAWKIRRRTCVRDTSLTLRVEEDMQATYGLAAGTRNASDPGATLLKLAHHTG